MPFHYSGHRIPFAIGPDGEAASIEEVANGLQCGCHCPECGARLVAKQGERRLQIWHFAHEAGANCPGALESSLHLAVKAIIERERALLVPACHVFRYGEEHFEHLARLPPDRTGEYIFAPYRYTNLPANAMSLAKSVGAGYASHFSKRELIKFDRVLVEQQAGNIRPDLIGVIGSERVLIEVAVTHFITTEKLGRIRTLGDPAIEIVVPIQDGQELTWESLRRWVLDQVAGKYWAYHPTAEALADADYLSKEPVRQARRDEEARRQAENLRIAAEAKQRRAAEKEEAARRAEEWNIQMAAAARAAVEEEKRLAAVRVRAIREAQAAQAERRRRAAEEEARLVAKDEATARELGISLFWLRHGHPSSNGPMYRKAAIFIDYDSAFLIDRDGWQERIQLFGQALTGRFCDVVITSEIRALYTSTEIAETLRGIGGRHISIAPLISDDLYGNRRQEIELWIQFHQPEHYLIVDGANAGHRPCDISLSRRSGFGLDDAMEIRSWLDKIRSDASG